MLGSGLHILHSYPILSSYKINYRSLSVTLTHTYSVPDWSCQLGPNICQPSTNMFLWWISFSRSNLINSNLPCQHHMQRTNVICNESFVTTGQWFISQTVIIVLIIITSSGGQKMCASSCWKRLTLVRPVRAPDSSFLCSTPKSAIRRGSSLHDLGRWSKMRLQKIKQGMKSGQSRHNVKTDGYVIHSGS